MADENQQLDPYDAVISDLQRKRDELDSLIKALVAFRTAPGGSFLTGLAVNHAAQMQVPPQDEDTAIGPGAFLGMSIVDAAKKLLSARKRAMPNAEILSELTRGGLVLTGADPLNVVGSVLTRRFNQVGDVVRVSRGTWGLKEWYPNRTFKSGVRSGSPLPTPPPVDGSSSASSDDFEALV